MSSYFLNCNVHLNIKKYIIYMSRKIKKIYL